MGKEIIMVLNENGYNNLGENDEFLMAGIVFNMNKIIKNDVLERQIVNKINMLEKLKKIKFNEDYERWNKDEIKMINNLFCSLPSFLEHLEFNIILSRSGLNNKSMENAYNTASRNLINKYNMFLKRNMCNGGIILENSNNKKEWVNKQRFFNLYNERNSKNESNINGFIIASYDNNDYKFMVNIMHLLDNIINLMCQNNMEEQEKKEFFAGKRNLRIIGEVLSDKIITETSSALELGNYTINYKHMIMEELSQEVLYLQSEIEQRDKELSFRENEIIRLLNEVEILHKKIDYIEASKTIISRNTSIGMVR